MTTAKILDFPTARIRLVETQDVDATILQLPRRQRVYLDPMTMWVDAWLWVWT